VGAAEQGVDPGVSLVGNQPEPQPAAHVLAGIGEVEVPALAPQRLIGALVGVFV
jgi:hypothetical protein